MYFKVTDGNLKSILVTEEPSIQYKVNEWVKPHTGCGPMAVFSYLPFAIAWSVSFMDLNGYGCKIWKCDIKESKEQRIYHPPTQWDKDEGRFGLVEKHIEEMPSKSVLCREVMLLEEAVSLVHVDYWKENMVITDGGIYIYTTLNRPKVF